MRYLAAVLFLNSTLLGSKAQPSRAFHPVVPPVTLTVLELTSDGCPTVSPCLVIQLKNNLRQGIIVTGYLNPRDSGKRYSGLEDQVVQDEAKPGTEPLSGIVLADEKAKAFLDAVNLPNREAQQREAIRRSGTELYSTLAVPHGFNSGIQPGITKLLYVNPGSSLEFKIPANHVGPYWHVEIPYYPVNEATKAVVHTAILLTADVPNVLRTNE